MAVGSLLLQGERVCTPLAGRGDLATLPDRSALLSSSCN